MRRPGYLLAFVIIGLLLFLYPHNMALGLQAVEPTASAKHFKISGVVYNEETGEPIPHVTVQVINTTRATKTNRTGHYQLILTASRHEIKISHVGYYSKRFRVSYIDTSAAYDIRLKPMIINMGSRTVFTRAYDPAQRIIAMAISRKKDILARIHDYSFDAYTKLVARDLSKPDSINIFLITETQSTSYWQQPDKYKEVITSRQQSANFNAEDNLIAVGEMLNFNRNRIDLGKYDVVSPTAKDAMDHYNYYLLDTVYVDEKAVYVLEVEPKNEFDPLFVGEIHIADSTYDVVRVDVGFSKGIEFSLFENFRYYQHFAQLEGDYWMPIQIGFSATVSFDIPFPGFPSRIGFEHTASISDYRIDTGHESGTFGEYAIEVDEKADETDSVAWAARQSIPLTENEINGYQRLDSIADNVPLHKKLLQFTYAGVYLMTFGVYDIFHYNRVEGTYLGYGQTFYNLIPNAALRAKTGYAFEYKQWQYKFGLAWQLSRRQKLWVGSSIKDEIIRRPTIMSPPQFNPTFYSLFARMDPFDYYREKGYNIFVSVKPINFTRLKASFHDYRHGSLDVLTDYGFGGDILDVRKANPAVEGKMRYFSASFDYDSRKLIRNKNRDLTAYAPQYIRASVGIEYSSPDIAATDFHFRRYYFKLQAEKRLFDLGKISIYGYLGDSDWKLPPQKIFIADFHDPVFFKSRGFNTLKKNNFGGDRFASVYGVFDLGPYMFRSTGIKFLQAIPIGFSLHGGAFWTEFEDPANAGFDEYVNSAPTAYTEIGCGLTNLTPFLTPFNMALFFTLQTSTYDSERYSITMTFLP